MEKTSRSLLTAGMIVAAVLFGGFLFGTGPTSGDCLREFTLRSASTAEILTGPLPDVNAEPLWNPVSALGSSVLARVFTPGSPGRMIAALFLHLVNTFLAAGILSRVAGGRAGAAGALVFALHPLHAALLASPLAAFQAGIATLCVLLCLRAAYGLGSNGHFRYLVTGPTLAALACLSGGRLCVPLVVLAYDLLRPREDDVASHRSRALVFHAANWILWGLAVAVRSAILESEPRPSVDIQELFGLLAAAPFGRIPGAGWERWLIPVLLLAAAALRIVRGGRTFPAVIFKAILLFLACALVRTNWGDGSVPSLEEAVVPLLFLAALVGALACGGEPTARRTGTWKEASGRTGAAVLGAATALCVGIASFLLLTEIKTAGDRARNAVDSIRHELREMSGETVFLFNRPVAVELGSYTVARYLENDLALGFGRAPEGTAFYPTHGHPVITAEDKTLLFLSHRSRSFDVSSDGSVHRYFATRNEIDRALTTVNRTMNPRLVGGRMTAVIHRNGFSFSLFPPVESVRIRAVLLTPFGPTVAGNIETAMRYPTGRETFFFDDERMRNRMLIIEGRKLHLWVEAMNGDGRRLQRSPGLSLRLITEN